jgi:RimJ/RimL family protein N-acetyltransferase
MNLALERSRGNDFLAVEEKASRKMIGHLYLKQVDPLEFMTWELGYIFNPRFFNKGYCTEASKAAVDYVFSELGAHRVVAFCNPLNAASWRVLEKIGMRREGLFLKKAFFRKNGSLPLWHDCLAYGILEAEWR